MVFHEGKIRSPESVVYLSVFLSNINVIAIIARTNPILKIASGTTLYIISEITTVMILGDTPTIGTMTMAFPYRRA